ncbi:hypothetical protein VB796_18815 [Arcicella sp. LKC2W]|uniref:hypothetical protein n=1 Tax=Arcicella sp. LKC2W TaxID=2984198 RepID=UPI002B1FDF19|nr:hypothetical protein [Arcicella sp. LKC2W]MEA5461122.1 hypothetical protein [Arcicella sp. LKC2W]
MILSYAFAKILGTQFTTQPSTYDKPVGLLSGFELTWYYFGYSRWYGILIASLQIISSLLLFFRKTTRIGVILFLSFMVNILLTDFAYNIEGAKGMASVLTMMALFIFFSEYPLLYKYLIEEPPLFATMENPKWIGKFRKIKWIYIPLVFIGFFLLISTLKNKYMETNKFYGTWQNVDNANQFNRVHFEIANTFKVNGLCNNPEMIKGTYTFTNDSIVLKSFDKKYQVILDSNKANDFLKRDTTKMATLLKGKYQINKSFLIIQINESTNMRFKRIR